MRRASIGRRIPAMVRGRIGPAALAAIAAVAGICGEGIADPGEVNHAETTGAAAVAAPGTAAVILLTGISLLAVGLFFGMGWYRLRRMPPRPMVVRPPVAVGLFIAMIVLTVLGRSVAMLITGIDPSDADAALSLADQAQLITIVFAFQSLVPLTYLYLWSRASPRKPDSRPGPTRSIVLGVAALALFWPMVWLVSAVGMQIYQRFTGEAVEPIAHELLHAFVAADRDVWFIVMMMQVVLAAAVFEEVMYRGLLQEALARSGLGPWPAITIASGIFTFMHIGVVTQPHALAALFVLSLGFGWAYFKTGRLIVPIVMHMAFNLGNIALTLALVDPPPG